MSDSLDKLATATGLAHGVLVRMAEEAQRNAEVLGNCSGHDFIKPLGKPALGTASKAKCRVCGGVVDGYGLHWYELGLKHGRGKA